MFHDLLLNRIRQSNMHIQEDMFTRYYRRLRKFKPAYLMGYPSFVYFFADFLLRTGLDGKALRLKFVKTTAEVLHDFQQETIEARFGCRCISEYGAAETGVISFECPTGGQHIMSPTVYVEFIDSPYEQPAPYKQIVITGLHSHAFPIIRYSIGDLGYPLAEPCTCGNSLPLMSKVLGRASEIVVGFDRRYHSSVFSYLMKQFISEGISSSQFRFLQNKPGVISVEMVTQHQTQVAHDEVKALKVLQNYFGDDMQFHLKTVSKIQRTKGGKLRYFISHL